MLDRRGQSGPGASDQKTCSQGPCGRRAGSGVPAGADPTLPLAADWWLSYGGMMSREMPEPIDPQPSDDLSRAERANRAQMGAGDDLDRLSKQAKGFFLERLSGEPDEGEEEEVMRAAMRHFHKSEEQIERYLEW